MRKVTQKGAHKTALPTAATSWNYNPVKSTYFRFFETGDVIWVDVNYVIGEMCIREVIIADWSNVHSNRLLIT